MSASSVQIPEQLAADKSVEVRIQLASNPSLPEVLQLRLAIDKSYAVVAALIESSSLVIHSKVLWWALSVEVEVLFGAGFGIKSVVSDYAWRRV
ncbi:hypothetical protein [uncultured Pseudomonas sp.]|uniref:hypothetical protein n=1 Tax=uncultured Pseudomonas sp. TaxID=114707 RepID=UPI002634B486|nr:hypothetical protein [uncultured Pseudomonas sp.]